MKIFEKCIRDELLGLCSEHIHPSQHGFLPSKSCTTQLVPFVDRLAQGLSNKDRIDVVYFDFAKAFDSVNHDIILNKLKNQFNIDGLLLKFIVNYLENRKQRVILGSGVSSLANVVSGVPQGSIIGPLLFVLFINDLHSVISPGTEIALYADDTKIWRRIDTEFDCYSLNLDIKAMTDWAQKNLMRFHPKKCKIVNIAFNIFLDYLPFQNNFPYEMNGILLDHETSETDLGLIINHDLNWSLQQTTVLSKALNQFNLLRRTCHFVNNPSKKRTLYLTIVRSLFEHCNTIWCPTQEIIERKFEPFQKRCIKWILNEQFHSYSETDYLKKLSALKIMPLAHKFALTDLKLFFMAFKKLSPLALPDYVVIRSNTRASTENGVMFGIDPNIFKPSNRKSVFYHSFFPRCVSRWNSLPEHVRSCNDVTSFVHKLEAHLWALVASLLSDITELEPD